jgi:hypothetical protein
MTIPSQVHDSDEADNKYCDIIIDRKNDTLNQAELNEIKINENN